MPPDHARMIVGIHPPAAGDGHLLRPCFDRDQVYRVVMLVLINELGMGIVIFHLPFEDFLPLRLLRGQPQALQRMNHGRVEKIASRMTDREAHQARNL